MRIRLCLGVFMFALVATTATAQQDIEGSKDHPMLSRFPGYAITSYDEQPFGAFEFEGPTGDPKRVEGKYWQIAYEVIEGRRKGGPIEIGRNYLKIFTDRGGTRVFEDMDASGGKLTGRMPVVNTHMWLQVSVSNSGEIYELTIVEEAAMDQKVEFTASDLARALNTTGVVALHGILFDTGKATITPESTASLAEVIALLTNDPALSLAIHGHTDNVGTPAANLKLSQDRAASVKAWLVRGGIAAARLSTAGFGDTKPAADNRADEGRAQNRRVELVKK